jgi:hypothetical protein
MLDMNFLLIFACMFCRQAAVARAVIEDKKHELVSLLLRSDGGHEYSKKMEELVAAARLRRESLVIECVPVLIFPPIVPYTLLV